jgi:hypothetical protein
MKATVFFSNENGKCKLMVDGMPAKKFDSVSRLLAFCRKHDICVTVNDCVAA